MDKEILEELKQIKSFLKVMALKGLDEKEQIEALYKGGYKPKEIATELNIAYKKVDNTLYRSKK